MLLAAAAVQGVQLYMYYQRDMIPIPRMMVDEADIVTYQTDDNGKQLMDENGKPIKNIEFDQYVYYDAVKCNRPEVGEISDWQSGVKEYQDAGCYDIADLNGDYGQEWLALYITRSLKKGNPILADTLTVQYGSNAMPKNMNKALHFFCYSYAADLGDTAYSFNNKQNGIYLFWLDDAKAAGLQNGSANTASAFSEGHMALAGAGGLVLGIICAALVILPRKKKKEQSAE